MQVFHVTFNAKSFTQLEFSASCTSWKSALHLIPIVARVNAARYSLVQVNVTKLATVQLLFEQQTLFFYKQQTNELHYLHFAFKPILFDTTMQDRLIVLFFASIKKSYPQGSYYSSSPNLLFLYGTYCKTHDRQSVIKSTYVRKNRNIMLKVFQMKDLANQTYSRHWEIPHCKSTFSQQNPANQSNISHQQSGIR